MAKLNPPGVDKMAAKLWFGKKIKSSGITQVKRPTPTGGVAKQ